MMRSRRGSSSHTTSCSPSSSSNSISKTSTSLQDYHGCVEEELLTRAKRPYQQSQRLSRWKPKIVQAHQYHSGLINRLMRAKRTYRRQVHHRRSRALHDMENMENCSLNGIEDQLFAGPHLVTHCSRAPPAATERTVKIFQGRSRAPIFLASPPFRGWLVTTGAHGVMLIAFKSAQTKEGGPAISIRDCDLHAHVVSTIASHLCRQQHGHACCYCSASPSRGTHRHLKSLAWTAHSDLNTCEPSRNPLPPRWGVCSHYEVEMEFAAVRLPVVMALAFGAVGALALVAVYSRWKKKNAYSKVVPWATYNHYGGLQELESFGDYVVRQWELDSESAIAKTAAKAAEGYLRDPRNVASESKEIACVLVAGFTHEDENDKRICADILQELEICLVAYFSSHWHHATSVLEKVLGTGTTMKRFHRAVSTALRKYRYDRLLQSLNTKRRFYTMIEELRRIARKYSADAPEDGAVTVPAESTKRSPVILFIGGGMGAGKSTVVKSILSSSFWSGVIHDAVVVEADAFKETDVIYRHLSSMSSDDIPGTAELVHQYSTEAANSLLVSALNEGRDVVFDGTMSWEPFVLQTIDMVRDIHNRRYRMGPGLREYPDGTKVEKYWEPVDDDDECVKETKANKRHYRIEFVGVTCDAHLAVVRGLRRAIVTKRGVPVKGQLRSHKMFAQNLAKYIEVVDCARIYSTSAWNGPAELIALKDGPGMKLLVDVESFSGTKCLADLNTDAGSVMELYKCCSAHNSKYVNQYWQTVVLDPERKAHQKRLRLAILDHASNTSALLERSTSDATSDAELRSSSDEDVTTKGSSDEDSSAI